MTFIRHAAALLCACVTWSFVAYAQSIPRQEQFDVASVKPNPTTIAELIRSKGGDRAAVLESLGIRTLPGGRLFAIYVTLRDLILCAFDIKPWQLEGGPAWMNTARFEIEARANRDATEQEINAMLRALLVERFALRTHGEVRQRPRFELTVVRRDGRLGPALKPTSAECIAEMEDRRQNATLRAPRPGANSREEQMVQMRAPECGVDAMTFTGPFRTFTMSGVPLSKLIARIDSELRAPIIDKTGLTGPFDAVLDFESTQPAQVIPGGVPDLDFQPVPLGIALQRQLGLKLEEVEGPLDFVIIDSAAMPAPD